MISHKRSQGSQRELLCELCVLLWQRNHSGWPQRITALRVRPTSAASARSCERTLGRNGHKRSPAFAQGYGPAGMDHRENLFEFLVLLRGHTFSAYVA